MPVIIDCCEEEPVITPIILAEFQFGTLINEITLVETPTIDIRIEYAEFIQMMYSGAGDFVFRPPALSAYNLLWIEYERSHSSAISYYANFARESRTLIIRDLLISRDLHNVINGPFKACIDVVVMSNVLQFGIKQRTVFSVASAPYIPVLKLCNEHIYQIVLGNCV
jgi:hypothetical protein